VSKLGVMTHRQRERGRFPAGAVGGFTFDRIDPVIVVPE